MKMREICVVVVILATIASASIIKNDSPNSNESIDLSEEEFLRNLTSFGGANRGRNTKLRSKIKDMLRKPQVPPINGDPVQAVSSRIPCECKNGICSCCIGGFFFNNKGCMKLKYIPEDFAFDLRMTFNDNTLYKNTVSGKNPRPICISPPRFDQWLEMCAKFHDIYFVGRNMHVCLDVTASIGDYDLLDRSFSCMKFGSDGVALVAAEDGGGHPGYPAVVNAGTDAEIDAGGTDDIENYDEVVG